MVMGTEGKGWASGYLNDMQLNFFVPRDYTQLLELELSLQVSNFKKLHDNGTHSS